MKTLSLRNSNRNPSSFKSTVHGRRAAALLVAVTLLNLSLPLCPVAKAEPGREALGATGIIRVSGTVTVDGVRGMSGQTVFTGCQIAASAGSESIIDLGRFTRLRLLAETDFTLDFSRVGISSELEKGVVRGFIPAGLQVNIRTPGGELITDPSQPVEFTLETLGENTKVSVEKGRVEMRLESKLQKVSVGEVFTTTFGSRKQSEQEEGLTNGEKITIFAAIGAAAAILVIALRGRGEPEPQFGDCVIVPSGESPSICP